MIDETTTFVSPVRAARSLVVASFPPPIAENPYQRLLYGGLANHGIGLDEGNRLKLGWLVRNRGAVQVLHFHWPEGYYRHGEGATRREQVLSWVRIGLFASRLTAARALGYRIAWTVHQARPHERSGGRIDRAGTRVLARSCDLALVHDRHAADRARSELGLRRVEVVPHGSYIGVYPPGRARDEMRAELGLPADATVFFFFGHLRRYKELDLLFSAFHALTESRPDAVLLVAGMALDAGSSTAVRAAVESGKVVAVEGYVPVERVAELFAASDVAVLPRGDGGTSGSLILALSLATPVIVADDPTYLDLLDDGKAGWSFAAGSTASLTQAMEQAVDAGAEGQAAKADAALAVAEGIPWEDSATLLAAHLRGVAA